MRISFKQLKILLADVDRNTLETTVIKHLLRLSTNKLTSDILYNAESEQTTDDISAERYSFIAKNLDNTCPDLFPK